MVLANDVRIEGEGEWYKKFKFNLKDGSKRIKLPQNTEKHSNWLQVRFCYFQKFPSFNFYDSRI